jgi:hypothetical protein
MAINVNEVYQTVLLILNKEQRGYMTPDEFNKIATQVQLEIFEKFFEDYNQYIRMPKTDVEFASRMDHIREEFQVFEVTADASAVVALSNVYTQPSGLHRFGSAFYTTGKNSPEIEIVSSRDYHQLRLSPLTQPNTNFPVATYQGDKLTVYPQTANPLVSDISFNYIRKPANVVWAFTVGSLGQYIYDSGVASTDFEISESQQSEVILKILQYSGIVIRDPQIVQAATQELQQEEVNSKR